MKTASRETEQLRRSLVPLRFESWTYWDTEIGYAFWDGEGQLVPDLVVFFARPFPRAVAGTPVALEFDVFSKNFVFQYYPEGEEVSNTEHVLFVTVIKKRAPVPDVPPK